LRLRSAPYGLRRRRRRRRSGLLGTRRPLLATVGAVPAAATTAPPAAAARLALILARRRHPIAGGNLELSVLLLAQGEYAATGGFLQELVELGEAERLLVEVR